MNIQIYIQTFIETQIKIQTEVVLYGWVDEKQGGSGKKTNTEGKYNDGADMIDWWRNKNTNTH